MELLRKYRIEYKETTKGSMVTLARSESEAIDIYNCSRIDSDAEVETTVTISDDKMLIEGGYYRMSIISQTTLVSSL